LKSINQDESGIPKRQTKGLSKKVFSFRCFSFGRKRKADGALGQSPNDYKRFNTMKKLIIFDFDGVIVDTFDLAFSIEHQVDPTLTKEQYSKSCSRGAFDFCREEKEVLKVPAVVDFFAKYEPVVLNMECVSGIKEVIEKLAKDFSLAIVSSTPEKIIKKFLVKNVLDKYFSVVLGPETDRSKSKNINSLMKKFDFQPSECLFITDTVSDIKEATEVAVDSVAVTWGWQNRELLQAGKPWVIVENPKELLEQICFLSV